MISTVGLITGEQPRVHELRGVHRAEHAQRDGEQERVEGPLEGADEQRRQGELGLEVVGAAGRLPDVLGLLVALVPDLAEERLPGDLGVGILDARRRPAWPGPATKAPSPLGERVMAVAPATGERPFQRVRSEVEK